MIAAPERCGLCRFWPRNGYAEANDLESGLAGNDRSECRRRAPVMVGESNRPQYPWTERGHWCGEFERRGAIGGGDLRGLLGDVADFLESEAENRGAAGSEMSDYQREPQALLERVAAYYEAMGGGK